MGDVSKDEKHLRNPLWPLPSGYKAGSEKRIKCVVPQKMKEEAQRSHFIEQDGNAMVCKTYMLLSADCF